MYVCKYVCMTFLKLIFTIFSVGYELFRCPETHWAARARSGHSPLEGEIIRASRKCRKQGAKQGEGRRKGGEEFGHCSSGSSTK